MITTSEDGALTISAEDWAPLSTQLNEHRGHNVRCSFLYTSRPSQIISAKARELSAQAYHRASVACEEALHKIRGISKSWKPLTRRGGDSLDVISHVLAEFWVSALNTMVQAVLKGFPAVAPVRIDLRPTGGRARLTVTFIAPRDLATMRYLGRLSRNLPDDGWAMTIEMADGGRGLHSVDGGSLTSSSAAAEYYISILPQMDAISGIRGIMVLPQRIAAARTIVQTLSRRLNEPSGAWGEYSKYAFHELGLNGSMEGLLQDNYSRLIKRMRVNNAKYHALPESKKSIYAAYSPGSGSTVTSAFNWKTV